MKYEIHDYALLKNLGSTDVLDTITVFSAAKLPVATCHIPSASGLW